MILTEFNTNGNWEYNVSPGIFSHNSQLDNCHVSISATSKLCVLCPLYSTWLVTNHLMSAGSVDINVKAVSALNTTYQSKSLIDSSTKYFIYDGASDDKATKCFISSHYHHNGRRRSVILKTTANNQCN